MIHDIWYDDRLAARWDTNAQTYTEFDAQGNVTLTRPLTAAELADFAADDAQRVAGDNRLVLLDRARTALADNATFLLLGSPTNAQSLAQLRALTRQVNGLIKLAVEDLADTNGT